MSPDIYTLENLFEFWFANKDLQFPLPLNFIADGYHCHIYKGVLHIEDLPFGRKIWIEGKPYYSYLNTWMGDVPFLPMARWRRLELLHKIHFHFHFVDYARLSVQGRRVDFFEVGDRIPVSQLRIRKVSFIPNLRAIYYSTNSQIYGMHVLNNHALSYRMTIRKTALHCYKDTLRDVGGLGYDGREKERSDYG